VAELAVAQRGIHDESARSVLPFGIGLHHAGLNEADRSIVEKLFEQNKIRVLISTSTLAWGVNLPAYLVVVKGTEYYDAKSSSYVDYPITDVLQMMGRAGRPQFDNDGKAVILVHEDKKNFYRKFLYEPFPVESSLHRVLTDHINAEVCSGMLKTREEISNYLTWTFFYRRLKANPCYYGATGNSEEEVAAVLSDLVTLALQDLERSKCIEIRGSASASGSGSGATQVTATKLGQVASFYYLSHETVWLFASRLHADSSAMELMMLLSAAHEYDEFPVRHTEDNDNNELNKNVKYPLDSTFPMDDAHTKVLLLLQAHLSRLPLPTADFKTDQKSMLDQAVRILQAMTDISATLGFLDATLRCMAISQMIMQASWEEDGSVLALLNGEHGDRKRIQKAIAARLSITATPEFFSWSASQLTEKILQHNIFGGVVETKQFVSGLNKLPRLGFTASLSKKVYRADEEVAITIAYKRENPTTANFAFCPNFPKAKQEGWWVVAGDPSSKDLLALRKISSGITHKGEMKKAVLSFNAPDDPGLYHVSLYLISEAYLGIDQEYSYSFTVGQE
jgi:replicative superfamily II helicase